MLCESKEGAEDLLFAILFVAKSPTSGCLLDGSKSQCAKYKQKLKELLNPYSEAQFNLNNELPSDHNSLLEDQEAKSYVNQWSEWADHINNSVEKLCNEQGDDDNAHYCLEFATYLLKNIKCGQIYT